MTSSLFKYLTLSLSCAALLCPISASAQREISEANNPLQNKPRKSGREQQKETRDLRARVGTYAAEQLNFENIRKSIEDNYESSDPYIRDHNLTFTTLPFDQTLGDNTVSGYWKMKETAVWEKVLEHAENAPHVSKRGAFLLDRERENKDFYVISNHDKNTGSYMSVFLFDNHIMQEQRLIYNLYFVDNAGISDTLVNLAKKYSSEFKPVDHKFKEKGLEITIRGKSQAQQARFLINDLADIEELRKHFVNIGQPIPYRDFTVKKAKVNFLKKIKFIRGYNTAKYKDFPLEFATTSEIVRITDNEYLQKFAEDEYGLYQMAQDLDATFQEDNPIEKSVEDVIQVIDPNAPPPQQTPDKQAPAPTTNPTQAPPAQPAGPGANPLLQ